MIDKEAKYCRFKTGYLFTSDKGRTFHDNLSKELSPNSGIKNQLMWD